MRRIRVPKIVSEHHSLRQLNSDLRALASTPVEELEEEDREMQAYRKKAQLLLTVPLKNYVRYRWLLLPKEDQRPRD